MKVNFEKSRLDAVYEYIPFFMVTTNEGEISNRQLPKGDQIKVKIKRAKQQQISDYREVEFDLKTQRVYRTTLNYDAALMNHVLSIKGMESIGVKDGKTLLDMETSNAVVQELIKELYNEVLAPDDSSARGGLSEGE